MTNTSFSSRVFNISLKSFSNEGQLCLSEVSLELLHCLSNTWQISFTVPTDSAANFTLLLVTFDPMFRRVVFKRLFKCSKCKSIGMLCPLRFDVFTVRHHFTWAASLGDKV